MKIDTVFIPVLIVVTAIILNLNGVISEEKYLGEPMWMSLFRTIAALCTIRLVVLFFQTLIHTAHHANPNHRTSIIIGHLFLGPIISIPYYYLGMRNSLLETQAEDGGGVSDK